MVGVQKTLLDFSLNRNPTINYGQGNEAEELTLLAIRERGGEEGSSSSFITGAETEMSSRGRSRGGVEEKQRVTRSSRGWWTGSA
jgi:hypothetical protein